jgi:catecholate siderophore receptor
MRTFFTFTLALAFTLSVSAGTTAPLLGTVVDPDGRPVQGARVVLHHAGAADVATITDRTGAFQFAAPLLPSSLHAEAESFDTATVELRAVTTPVKIVVQPSPIAEEMTVVAAPLLPTRSSTATKTDTPLRDVPQSVTVITREVIAQQSMRSIGDVVRYVPGIGIAQGEGNRDTPVFRGNSSTSDFFVDGVRDDVQYFRDLYNVERVEALKGPNAMMFGRGGVGGVLNRVTRQADWSQTSELTVQGGSWDNRRVSADFGDTISGTAAARVTGMFENSGSFREGVRLERYGINPTAAFALGDATVLRVAYEHFRDDRTADRGITSYAGRPVSTDASTFFGNADISNADVTVNAWSAAVDHRFSDRLSLRSRIGYGDYDKFYQNVYPGAVDATATKVSISAYNNATQRRNAFSQTDLVLTQRTGSVGHTVLAGLEIGRQVTDNFRNTGYFTSLGANVTSVSVPLTAPTTSLPLTFRQSATDADNHGIATVAALYVQDQMELSKHLQLIAGLRYDRFAVDLDNHRTAATFESRDGLLSPRLGLVYKPIEPVSIYASYSLSYLPRAGEQLSSLSLTNQSLDPEEFTNYEVGMKWDVAKRIEFAASAYRLDRGNVAVADPLNPSVSTLVKGQQTRGIELSAGGSIINGWSIVGAYAWQEGEITSSISATALEGARIAQLPRHSASLWNKYDFSRTWGAGVGVIHRGAIFTSTDNTVTLPSFTRVDAALFYSFGSRMQAQLNVENLLDTKYYATANSNTNITPGSPRAVRLTWNTRF